MKTPQFVVVGRCRATDESTVRATVPRNGTETCRSYTVRLLRLSSTARSDIERFDLNYTVVPRTIDRQNSCF